MRVDYPRARYDGVRRFVPSFRQLLLLGAVGFLALVAVISVAYAATSIPQPKSLVSAQTTIVYFDNGKTEIGRFGDQNRIIIPLDQVPDHVQKAVLAAEDRTFYENRGISPTGIARAFWSNLRGGATQGGSTITQQYAKNAYLSSERTYTRKFKEFFIAVKLARRDDKDKILQDYLNTIYFGRGAYGIQTAAQTYFGVDAKDLTVEQGAVLASVIRSPAGYDPTNHPDRLQPRFDYVLDGMVAKGWLDPAKRDGMTVPPLAEGNKPKGGTDYYLMDAVRRELKANGFTDRDIDLGGLRVISTFDRRSQRAAVRAVRQERPRENAKNVHIGLSAVEPGTGAVVAMYGGAEAGGLNEVTQARVQPGSSFKPFTLAAALRGRHLAEEPVLRQLAVRRPRHRQGGEQRVRPQLRLVHRPRDRTRAVHQHRLRRPQPRDGAGQDGPGGDRRRHPGGHPGAAGQRRQHPRYRVGAQHRHGQRLRDLRRRG